MKQLLIIVSLLFIGLNLFSQSNHFNINDVNNVFYTCVVEDTSRNYVLLSEGGQCENITLYKKDLQANTFYFDSISNFPRSTYGGQISKIDGGFVLVCSTRDTCLWMNNEASNIFIQKYDEELNLIGEFEIESEFEDIHRKFIQTKDGGQLIQLDKFTEPGHEQNSMMFKVDSSGQLSWQYDFINDFELVTFEQMIDSNFLVVGSNIDKIYYSIIDNLGNLIRTDSLQIFPNIFVSEIKSISDSNFILIGAYQPNSMIDEKFGFILKLDNNLDTLISRKFSYDSLTFFISLDVNNVNEIIVYSSIGKEYGSLSNYNFNREVVISKFDEDLNLIWQRNLKKNQSRYSSLQESYLTNDRGLIFCGVYADTTFNFNERNRSWLVKLDCYGFDSLSNYNYDSICSLEDCIRYNQDKIFSISIDSTNLIANLLTVFTYNTAEANISWDFGDGFTVADTFTYQYQYNEPGLYDISMIFEKGICKDTIVKTIFVGPGLGLSAPSIPLLRGKFSPNPNNGEFILQNDFDKEIRITIIDTQGKVVFEKLVEAKKSTIHLELEKGIYFVTFDNEFTEKMILK